MDRFKTWKDTTVVDDAIEVYSKALQDKKRKREATKMTRRLTREATKMTRRLTWWEEDVRKIYAGLGVPGGMSNDDFVEAIYQLTHGAGNKRVAFWVGPNNEIEVVEYHEDSPDEQNRGLSPRKSGWIRGRWAEIPQDWDAYVRQGAPVNEFEFRPNLERATRQFIEIFGGTRVVNLYADRIEDYAEDTEVLHRFVININRIPGVTMHDSDYVAVSLYPKGQLFDTLGNLKAKADLGASKYKETYHKPTEFQKDYRKFHGQKTDTFRRNTGDKS